MKEIHNFCMLVIQKRQELEKGQRCLKLVSWPAHLQLLVITCAFLLDHHEADESAGNRPRQLWTTTSSFFVNTTRLKTLYNNSLG